MINSETMNIRGAVDREMNFTVTALDTIEQYSLPPLDILSFSGRTLETGIELSGVRLKKVLETAGIQSYDEKVRARIFIEATARDGFYAIFSFHEVFNSVSGESIVVVTRKNGKPLQADTGPLQIISASDVKTGSRYLKMVEKVYVKVAG